VDSHLLLEEAVEDEDEHPLQSVEDGEEVRHHDGGLVEEEQAEGPRERQQTQENEGPRHPRPAESDEDDDERRRPFCSRGAAG